MSVADGRAAGADLTPAEAWVLSFARRPEEHLTDDECAWFVTLTSPLGVLPPAAEDAFARRPAPAAVAPASPAAGHHLGDVGVRRRFDVTVTRIESLGLQEYNGKVSERFVCEFEDPHKNLIVWFTGENLDFEVGETAQVAARVEAHSEYRGRKQTRVSRVRRATK